jgi:CRISPR-associated endoribonuclease Cas6
MPEIVIDHLISDQTLRLGNEEYEIVGAAVHADPIDFDIEEEYEMDIVAISPIVIHKTYYEGEKKKTLYLKPYDPEYSQMVEENLKNKLKTISDADPIPYNFHISPMQFELPKNEAVVKYRDFIIKGYTGKYHISGSSLLIKIAYHTGIGTKNAQGFGMFKIEKLQKKEK